MKKIVSAFLAIILALALSACDNDGGENTSSLSSSGSSVSAESDGGNSSQPESEVSSEEQPLHFDTDENGFCDHCSEAMCALSLDEHRIPEGKCLCELCGEGSHTEGNVHPFCGICSTRLPMTDENGDEVCDVCGEYTCGGPHHGSSHADEDEDDKCDICNKYMCGLVWGLEHNINYDDGIYDGLCDNCGQSPYAMGYGDDDRPHADADGDGICDCCNNYLCDLHTMPEFGGVDSDGDEKCDICGYIMCDGHGSVVYHYDFNGDTKCDRCDHFICVHGFLPHTDGDGNNICDNCHGLI